MESISSTLEELFEPPADEQWRRYGEEHRRKLIQEDESKGGSIFTINKNIRLQRYFDLVERVAHQFHILCDNLVDHVEDAYVLGHRLLRFLQTGLPSHAQYTTESGFPIQEHAAWLQVKLEDIAILIDEKQLNTYMDQNYDPVQADDSVSDEEDGDWESVTDWAFKDSALPRLVDTDTSEQNSSESETENDGPPSSQSPPRFLFDIEQDDFYEPLDHDLRYVLNVPVLASNFLKRIANEDVRYESDSEAADSWAQDGNSAAYSGASSGTALTYDPARIAFRELMNKKFAIPPPPPPDATSPLTAEAGERRRFQGKRQETRSDEWGTVDLAFADSAEL